MLACRDNQLHHVSRQWYQHLDHGGRQQTGEDGKFPTSPFARNSSLTVWLNVFLPVCVQVRPKVEFCSLLQQAGATKDVFTMKEVHHFHLLLHFLSALMCEGCRQVVLGLLPDLHSQTAMNEWTQNFLYYHCPLLPKTPASYCICTLYDETLPPCGEVCSHTLQILMQCMIKYAFSVQKSAITAAKTLETAVIKSTE